MALPPLIAALLRPEMYSPAPPAVELVQTHISYVLLAGADVFKIKKAVRFDFLDFSTLPRRRHFCGEEVRLNRRLTTDVYRGVVGIAARGGSFAFVDESDPKAVEVAVHMRRLPAERMLSELLRRGAADTQTIDAIAARLVEFHAAAAHGPQIAANGAPHVLIGLMEKDFAEVEAFHGKTISAADDRAIQSFCVDYARRHESLLRDRQAQGRIRDCHGDLRAEHICVETDALQIFDCIEFEPKFRHRDVAAEIAFLAMDIEYEGHRELADRLVATYARLSGDTALPRLVPFYQCHLAYIRGKVDSLKSAESDVPEGERRAAARSAARHFALAMRYSWAATPLLVVVSGLSGTGKSTLAAALCERTGFAHLSSDVIRKQLAGLPIDAPAPAEETARLYTAARSRQTYATLLECAGDVLAGGRGVVVDATFQRRPERDAVRAVARRAGVALLFVECVCDEEQIRRRLDRRAQSGAGPSDADWEIYCRQRANAEPFAADEEAAHLVVDTGRAVSAAVEDVEARLRVLQGALDG